MAENDHPGGHLTTVQRKALEALISGASKQQAAIVAGRTERTINRWLTDCPAFKQALNEASAMAIDDASRRLALMLNLATQRLYDVLMTPTANTGTMLRAFDLTVSNLIKLRDHGQLEERIQALEERIQ